MIFLWKISIKRELWFLGNKAIDIISVIFDDSKALSDDLVRDSNHDKFSGFTILFQPRIEFIGKHPLKYSHNQKVRAVTPIGYSPNGMI